MQAPDQCSNARVDSSKLPESSDSLTHLRVRAGTLRDEVGVGGAPAVNRSAGGKVREVVSARLRRDRPGRPRDGDNKGHIASSLTVLDIATGWTEVRTVRNKAAHRVFCTGGDHVALPLPLLGIDSDDGSEFINDHLLHWCVAQQITFTHSRPANKNDGYHVE